MGKKKEEVEVAIRSGQLISRTNDAFDGLSGCSLIQIAESGIISAFFVRTSG